MLSFHITVKAGYRNRTILVKQIYQDERIERYQLQGRDRTITIESNRPFFRNRGLKHRKPDWKIVDGQVYRGNTFDQAIQEIMKVIDR